VRPRRSLRGIVDLRGWKRFFSALLALGLAFLLAIYSNIYSEEGHVAATAVCASLALLLSGYVAVTAVPYLVRRTGMEWLRVSIDYRLTREGTAFIVLILILAVAGLNTGNNLLYLVLSSLLAALLMSGTLSLAVLTGVELGIALPEHVFARRLVPARIRLENQKKWLPSFAITLLGNDGQPAKQHSKKKRRTKGKGVSAAEGEPATPPVSTGGRILPHPLYFSFLPAASATTRTVELEFPRRGHYREKGFLLSTRFPFGFLEKTLRLPVSHDLWVYPAVEPAEEFYEILPLLTGEMEAFAKGRGHDLYSIRDMVPSDSARHVDWKASARSGTFKVREFAREDERRLQLVLDPRIGPPNETAVAQFEAAVELCACLAWHFYEVPSQLQFSCGEFSTPAGRADEVIYTILRFLAAVEPSSETPSWPPAVPGGENVFRIICTAAPRGSIPTPLWSGSYLVFFDGLRPIPSRSAVGEQPGSGPVSPRSPLPTP